MYSPADFTTENIAKFRLGEIMKLRDILNCWIDKGLPQSFTEIGVRPAYNNFYNDVFLTNDDYQIAMLNGDKLDVFLSTPHGKHQGFLHDLIKELSPDNLHPRDLEYLLNAAEQESFELSPPWLCLQIERLFARDAEWLETND